MTRLVLVPISVQVPPRIAAKLSGMSSCDTGRRYLRAQSPITGIRAATTGVLLRNALITVVGSMTCAWA